MKLENLWVMLSALVGLLSLRVRKWLKRPQKLSVSYQVGNDTLSHLEIKSSLNQGQKKDD